MVYFLALQGMAAPVADYEVDRRPTVAILPLEARIGVSPPQAQLLSDRFVFEIGGVGVYRVIPQERMREVLDLKYFSQIDQCAAIACAVEAGRDLGVRYMIYGSIGQLEQTYIITSYLVDVETAAQVKSASTTFRGDLQSLAVVAMGMHAHELLGAPPPGNLQQQFQRTQRIGAPVALRAASLLKIEVTPSHADLTLDGLSIQPGIHEIVPHQRYSVVASAEGYIPYRMVYWLRDGETRDINITLARETERRDKSAFIGPRIGFSMFSGVLGGELQLGPIGFTAGIVPGIHGGMRLYFTPKEHSWFLAAGGGFWDSADYDDDLRDEWYYGGVALGHRWMWPAGHSFSLALGVGAYTEIYEYRTIQTQREGRGLVRRTEVVTEKDTSTIPMIEAVWGYSF